MSDFKDRVAGLLMGVCLNEPAGTKPIEYVVAKNGTYCVTTNKIGTFKVEVDKIPCLKEFKPGFEMKLPKLPITMLFCVISFFKCVNRDKNGCEAMVHIYWDAENTSYIVDAPDQVISGGSVKAIRNHDLEKKYLLTMDIHSHNTMGAFFSGTDDADEKETRLFGVIGKIEEPIPAMKFRAGHMGEYVELDIDQIFEFGGFPEEWVDVCKESVSPHWKATKTYTGSYFGDEWRPSLPGFDEIPEKTISGKDLDSFLEGRVKKNPERKLEDMEETGMEKMGMVNQKTEKIEIEEEVFSGLPSKPLNSSDVFSLKMALREINRILISNPEATLPEDDQLEEEFEQAVEELDELRWR